MTDAELILLDAKMKGIDMNWVYHQICMINARHVGQLQNAAKADGLSKRVRDLEIEVGLLKVFKDNVLAKKRKPRNTTPAKKVARKKPAKKKLAKKVVRKKRK